MLDMVQDEVASLGGIITINGVYGQPPRLDLPPGEGEGWAERLAGGVALEHSVMKSYAEFSRRALGLGEDLSDPEAKERLAELAQWWTGRLATIGATVLHAVFARTQRAVLERI